MTRALTSQLALTAFGGGDLRLYPVMADNMSPTLRMDSHLVCGRSIDAFDGEAMYVFEGGAIYQAEIKIGSAGKVSVYSHNPLYRSQFGCRDYTREQFAECVVAKVIADVRFHDFHDRDVLWCEAAAARRAA